MVGYNTDYLGFGMLLNRYEISIKNESVAILGTGGASKAVFQYLQDYNAKEIIFVSRNTEIGKKKYPGFNVIEYSDLKYLNISGIIINCTPVGMYPKTKATPINKELLSKFHTAVDLIYNPNQTVFLRDAKELNLKAVNGLYMLIGQAVKAQQIWNNADISHETIERVYKEIDIFHSWR